MRLRWVLPKLHAHAIMYVRIVMLAPPLGHCSALTVLQWHNFTYLPSCMCVLSCLAPPPHFPALH